MELKERIRRLSPEQRAALASRIREGKQKRVEVASGGQNDDLLRPDPEKRFAPFPLTDMQQAYWIGRTNAFEMGGIASRAYMEIECDELDVERLKGAFNQLIARHDMLRTIILEDGQQRVLEDVPDYVPAVADLSQLSSRELDLRLEEIHLEMFHGMSPASEWPLFEVRFSKTGARQGRIHLCLDLLSVDAGSIAILLKELGRLYKDPEVDLPHHEVRFRDYVLAEQRHQQGNQFERSKAYWTKRLEEIPPAPSLPLAKPPAMIQVPRFSRRKFLLESHAYKQLKAKCSEFGVTTTGVLLTALGQVLGLWSRNPKFTLNLPIFNRLPFHSDVNEIVGAFTSLELLAMDMSIDESFVARARRVQTQLLEDLDHRYYEGVKVMRDLNEYNGSGSMPFVFTSLVDVGFDDSAASLGRVVRGINQTAQVWMDVHVDEQQEGLLVKWDSVDELFPAGLPDDLLHAYGQLLNTLARESNGWEQTRFDLMPRSHAKLIAESNDTEARCSDSLIHTLFERQAAERPKQAAVITPTKTLSYEELDRLSNQIGRRLREAGARPNTLVAIVMEKGWEQLAGVYGVLKSGAAYVPFDSELPKDRLFSLFQQSRVQLVLTQPCLDHRLDWPDHVSRIVIDHDDFHDVDDGRLEPIQEQTDPAYVIYTSGSTGTPKGVTIGHRSVVNRMTEINERFCIGSGDRVFGLTALQHDLSVYDLFGTLWAGATLVLPSVDGRRDPAHWLKLIHQEKVSFWNSVPTFMEMLVDHLEHISGSASNAPEALRAVILAGDWIPVNLPNRLRKFVPDVEFIASGGPTETTVWDIWYPVKEVDSDWKSIPYGRPLRNTKYHILNPLLQPCPVWVTGEMYISGEGLAIGYWGDERETTDKFITHPDTGERLYRSGDTGRWLPDGNIEFMGRDDFQIKIRGYRIELGEIESTLRKCPAIKETVVTVKGESSDARQLVAYVVPTADRLASSTPAASTMEEAYTPPGLEHVITDPIERMDFKMKHLHVREEQNESIELNRSQPPEMMRDTYLARQSYRLFQQTSISLEQFSGFLSSVSGLTLDELPFPKYRYPSPGNLFPVQTYVHVKPGRIEGLEGGIYYYRAEVHRLEPLAQGIEIPGTVHTPNNIPIAESAAFSVFLIAQLAAIEPLYGGLARDFCLLEAGYMSQLLMSEAPSYEIGLCPIGGLDFDRIRKDFALDESHAFLHSLVGGPITQEQQGQFTIVQPESTNHAASPSNTDSTDIAEVAREFLQRQLPDYMVPSAFVRMDSIPLTANGKVNREALPQPPKVLAPGSTSADTDSLDRRMNENERKIAKVFEEVLQTPVGLGDSFFDSGGNSLRILQAHRMLTKSLNVELTIADVFRNPTVAGLASFLFGAATETNGASPKATETPPRPAERHQGPTTSNVASCSQLPPLSPAESNGVATVGNETLPVGPQLRTTGPPPAQRTPIKDSFLGGLKNRFIQILALYVPGLKTIRPWLHRQRGVRMGENVMIGMQAIIETAHPRTISIGNNVEIGIRAVIIGHFRETTRQARLEGRPTVLIEDNVFIGPGSTILPNVTIGSGSVVAAGSVVNESVPPKTVVQGNPARPVARCEVPLVGNTYAKFVENLVSTDSS